MMKNSIVYFVLFIFYINVYSFSNLGDKYSHYDKPKPGVSNEIYGFIPSFEIGTTPKPLTYVIFNDDPESTQNN